MPVGNPGRTLLALAWIGSVACRAKAQRIDAASLLQETLAPRAEAWQVTNKSKLVYDPTSMDWKQWKTWAFLGAFVGDVGVGVYDYMFRGCSLLAGLWWYISGLVVLVLLDGRKLEEAAGILGQQVSTVGYGSDTPAENNYVSKAWHAAHMVTSVLSAQEFADWPLHAVSYGVHKFAKSSSASGKGVLMTESSMRAGILFMAFAFGFAIFWLDLGLAKEKDYYTSNVWLKMLDALYQAIVTMTSVGYGDISPLSKWAKGLSIVILPVLTSAWSQWLDWLLNGDIKDITYLMPTQGRVCTLIKQLKSEGKPLPPDLHAAVEKAAQEAPSEEILSEETPEE